MSGAKLIGVWLESRPRHAPLKQGLDCLSFQHSGFQHNKRLPGSVVQLLTLELEARIAPSCRAFGTTTRLAGSAG